MHQIFFVNTIKAASILPSAQFITYKVSTKVLTGDTALLKHSTEDESTPVMLQSCISELLSLVST